MLKLKAIRLLRGKTQKSVARDVGIYRGTLNRIECGRLNANTEEIKKLEAYYCLPASDLLSRVNDTDLPAGIEAADGQWNRKDAEGEA